jgi:hypothetical protein
MSTAKTVKPATTNITELAAFFPDTLATASNADLRKLGSKAALAELKAREKAGVVVAGGTVTAKPKGRVSNRFTKGTALFHCNNCGRGTRDTGRGDNEGVGLCEQCYELAGYENQLQDGKEFSDSDKHTVNEYLRQLSTFVGRKAYDLHPELVAAVTAAPNSGINPEKAPKAVLKEVVKATPKRTQEAQKPSAVKKVTVNTKVRAKVAKKVAAPKVKKAAPAPEPERFTDWMVWAGDTVIDVIMSESEALTREEAQKRMSMRYNGPVTVTTVAEGHKRNDYLKSLKKGRAPKAKATPKAKGEKAQKAARKAPATPKGELSESMKAELTRISNSEYEDSKTASCARMHLKMRGLIEGTPADGYTVTEAGEKALTK